MKNKIIVLGDAGINSQYKTFISKRVFPIETVEFITYDDYKKNGVKPNVVLFTGGNDIDPAFYGENKGKFTQFSDTDRDLEESEIYSSFKYNDVFKLGICRGSQLLCVLNGGKLIQHVEGHNGSHTMTYNENFKNPLSRNNLRVMTVPSDHHQMMYPYEMNKNSYSIMGWSSKYKSDTYLNGKNKEINLPNKFFEPEIVYFEQSNSLCIQYHPEYDSTENSTKNNTGSLIRKLVYKK